MSHEPGTTPPNAHHAVVEARRRINEINRLSDELDRLRAEIAEAKATNPA